MSIQSEFGATKGSKKPSCISRFEQDESSQESTISNTSTGKYGRNLIVIDPIHGHIELHPVLVAIMDTPQFQRLRYIRQLGTTYFVFPGGIHTRFEHSIGVSHLTRQLLMNISQKQPCLGITELDILCCEIAGLCHDLGHGFFSHLYEHFLSFTDQRGWKHENMSTEMLDYLIRENNLMEIFNKYHLNENDISFVKEMISNKPGGDLTNEWPYIGRGKEKSFLYDIVANKGTGMDVDKWDYIERDAYYLGVPNSFDSSRLMKFMRVIEVDGVLQICLRDKALNDVYEMYATRAKLSRNAYFHKTVKGIELMLCDAFVLADPYLKIPTADTNRFVTLSGASKDPIAFSLVNDSILHAIMLSPDPNLDEAKSIINRIMKRELYPLIGKMYLVNKMVKSDVEITKEICSYQSQLNIELEKPLLPEDLKIESLMIHFGMKQKNPIDKLYFFSKSDINKAFLIPKSELSYMLPSNFGEYIFRVYCRRNETVYINRAKDCFRLWKEKSSVS
ncbi:Deoxynucleoside triphosphate triphosphohydrolase SAMHD1-like [Oopsacas minuta]|uniref:Deoxynucleoside triphosphate triphosphohydrolase SAMHD1-like n=1 Tax=Oopsacas minuta TaxID=111878 RepID=A0AAV7KLD0_9METZ|nr:Deoxynucleoside triphosphate triphosphohydrolase SAMHD1-like [Oopsacas minuta]